MPKRGSTIKRVKIFDFTRQFPVSNPRSKHGQSALVLVHTTRLPFFPCLLLYNHTSCQSTPDVTNKRSDLHQTQLWNRVRLSLERSPPVRPSLSRRPRVRSRWRPRLRQRKRSVQSIPSQVQSIGSSSGNSMCAFYHRSSYYGSSR